MYFNGYGVLVLSDILDKNIAILSDILDNTIFYRSCMTLFIHLPDR